MPHSIAEAMNRGNNLLMVVLMAIVTFGVTLHQFSENELLDKADDVVFIVLGLTTIAWYLRGRNRYQHSWVPLGMLALGLLDKGLALINELNDPSAATDEYAVGGLLVIFIIMSGVIMLRSGREGASPMSNVAIPQTGSIHDQE